MKKLLSLLIALSVYGAGYSQIQFHHGVGLNYLVNFKSGSAASAIEAVYHPRITFMHKDNLSLGAGIPLGLGFQFQASTFGGSGGALLVDVPVMFDLNIGHGSSEENDSKVGGYVGVGFRYLLDVVFGGGSSATANLYGPGVHGGVRFRTGNDHSFGVGVNYAYDLNYNSNIIGAGVMYNFK